MSYILLSVGWAYQRDIFKYIIVWKISLLVPTPQFLFLWWKRFMKKQQDTCVSMSVEQGVPSCIYPRPNAIPLLYFPKSDTLSPWFASSSNPVFPHILQTPSLTSTAFLGWCNFWYLFLRVKSWLGKRKIVPDFPQLDKSSQNCQPDLEFS